MSPRVIQLPFSGRDRRHYVAELRKAEDAHRSLVVRVDAAYRVAHRSCRDARKKPAPDLVALRPRNPPEPEAPARRARG
jgi:hypothetical protein